MDVGAGLETIILCQILPWHTETNYKLKTPLLSSTHPLNFCFNTQ